MPQLPRTGVSIREFARLDGCSHTAVQNALKTGHLKVSEDGSLDPALAKTNWRPGNYRPIRGGKPRSAERQVATERQPAPAELPRPAWRPPTEREEEMRDMGFLNGVAQIGGQAPALAAEVALRHGLAADSVQPFFAEMRQAVRELITAEIEDWEVDPDFAIKHYCDHDAPVQEFLPLVDYRLPGEDEEVRWARVVATA